MIKLIASDLDGTLLQNEAQELTPRAIELIRALTQKGVHFVAASGRQYANERLLFHEIKDDAKELTISGVTVIVFLFALGISVYFPPSNLAH